MGYIRFALAEPGLFRTAFGHVDPEHKKRSLGVMDVRPYQLLSEVLDDLTARCRIVPERRAFAEVVAWSAAHGLALLLLDGPLRALPEAEREAAIERTLAACRDGICTQ